MKKNRKKGFTLVELLAVIVILAIILVIAVPKVMSVIEDSKKATLESTAKMIASSAEKQKVQNTVLGNSDAITCDSVAKINKLDYDTCDIDFDNNTAKVTIKGKGKFANLYVCNGTKTSATATEEECPVAYGVGSTYIKNLLAKEETLNNGLVQTSATYTNEDSEEITVDAGIRYVGALTGDNAVKNQVYFNCEDEYTSGDKTIKYADEDYVYKDHCEVWRIIGVFEVEDGNGKKEPRIKIININSTFKASWDSSASETNSGLGINQWGPSGSYEGADLMQLLNGYYIEKNDSTIATADKKECKYNKTSRQSGFGQTCDTTDAPLSSVNMKPLTSTTLSMIDDAVWDTYAVKYPSSGTANSSWAPTAYLEEKGISEQYTGISECSSCSDGVTRTTSWTGLIGLMSVSDITYANGWLYNGSICPWAISPLSSSFFSSDVWFSYSSDAVNGYASGAPGVWPAAYLSSNVQIIGGDGTEGNAYKLSVGEQ